ncbi:hypothetical protein TCT1_27420 [Xenorhabdus sp. TCT-1]|uniref:Phage tail collar domain-containing protein n=1 Tax=Xenorhabdus taiwanensis TaxID=3085177 RepID=A0ABN7C617_9GAMM|nr:hypothetical protein TCT1_27420 [Xenorhabdus sp. TCT-1]
MRSVDEIPSLGYNGPFRGSEQIHYARGVSIGDTDYGQIWVNSIGRLFAQFSNTDGGKSGGECIYTNDIVGIPMPWPTEIPPVGWLKCNGAKFTKSEYPKLAEIYPSGVLPDLRGEFIRGWDDSRGIDISRNLLSWQDATQLPNIYIYARSSTQGSLVTPPINSYSNSYPTDNTAKNFESPTYGSGQYFSTANQLIPTGAVSLANFKTRPRNIAFNYILRAK